MKILLFSFGIVLTALIVVTAIEAVFYVPPAKPEPVISDEQRWWVVHQANKILREADESRGTAS